MNDWDRFTSFKQRGEWVELQFMAEAAKRRLAVSKPWGDMQAYDVGIEHGSNFLRVQVKSTTYRVSAGYLCQFQAEQPEKMRLLAQRNRRVRRICHPRRCLVPHPGGLTAGQAQTHHGHAVPRSPTEKKGLLPLRMLPRSLEFVHKKPRRTEVLSQLKASSRTEPLFRRREGSSSNPLSPAAGTDSANPQPNPPTADSSSQSAVFSYCAART